MRTTPDPYDLIAAWYDLEHSDFDADIDLYRGIAESSGGPVLELACGSGRVLAPLAQAGVAITGVDRSAAMLARCRTAVAALGAEAAARVTLVEGDMASLTLDRRDYRCAIVALGSFQHLGTLDARRAALSGARAHIVAGATLALDLAQAEARRCATLAESGQIAHVGTWLDDVTGMTLTHTMAARHAAEPPALVLTHWYDSHAQSGSLTRVTVETEFAPVSLSELTLLLEATGWRLRRAYGDYDLGDYDEASARLIAVAQAAE